MVHLLQPGVLEDGRRHGAGSSLRFDQMFKKVVMDVKLMEPAQNRSGNSDLDDLVLDPHSSAPDLHDLL